MADYISREAVLKAFRITAKNSNKDYQRGLQDAIDCLVPEVIADIPTADVQPVKRGHWEKLTIVPATDTGNCILARCSKCGDTVFYTVTGREITLKYCPNCGARMDLGDEKT